MRHVKRYKELFESQTELSQEQIEWLDERTRGKWTLNPQTGLVDVDGGFYCSDQRLTDFKGVKFGVVTEYFHCSFNRLTSLEGAPQKVGGSLYCYENQLTSLEGAPQQVEGDFDCSNNRLTSLEGAPQQVKESFYCLNNQLTSLKGAPQQVEGSFDCTNNQLTSLEGAPQSVGGDFYCIKNQLTSLEGAPSWIGESFYCSGNPVSEGALEDIYDIMRSGVSWPDAVAEEWDSIESDEDKALLAPYNHTLSPEDLKSYQALGRLRKRVL